MTRSFVPVQRFAALSVAITLLTSTVASAQSPNAATHVAPGTSTPLLSPSAFARLAHVAAPETAPPTATEARRSGLLRTAETMAREMAPKAPPRRTNTHKENMIALGVVLGIVGALFIGAWAASYE